MAEKEIEYESDPEEAKLTLKMRRKEASDEEGEEIDLEKTAQRRIEDSDGESEGAVAEYEDELEEDYDLGDYVEDEIEEEVQVKHAECVGVERDESVNEGGVVEELMEKKVVDNGENEVVNDVNNRVVDDGQVEEKKEIEPFAVPTAGAFYMHDDRFRDNAGGRNRRTLGGRKLWESKDDRKWGHDKFEQLTVQERHHEEHRRGSRGRGRGRGRGRNRFADLGNAHRNRPRENANISTQYNDNRIDVPKDVKGRGPQRYQQSFKNNNEAPLRQNKQSTRSVEKPSYARTSERVSNSEADEALPRKQVASNLNIASPPFYPTGSSTKDNSTPHKKDLQAGTVNRKNTMSSIGVEKLYIDDSLSAIAGKPSNNLQIPQSRGQGRGITPLTQMAYRPVDSNNQVNRVPSQSQLQSVQRNSGQIHAQSSVNAFESEVESASESSQSKNVVVAKGKGNAPGSGKGSFLYGGSQVIGASGSMGSGDQNFPTFLPVMQFGGQHSGGMGVPAVGMAFPGYVGRGNSEMTWLPVLAGAAGALGASFPPYISYQAHPSGQTSSITAAPSQENNATKVGNDWKPTQRPELANDDFGQRQKNPRRYTEMKFDQ